MFLAWKNSLFLALAQLAARYIRIVEVIGIESGMLHYKPVSDDWFF